MSVVNRNEEKICLPRTGPDEFWTLVARHYADSNPRKWKYLAMLVLREHCLWSIEQIALTFQHQPGHITRCLEQVKRELRDVFEVHPELARRASVVPSLSPRD